MTVYLQRLYNGGFMVSEKNNHKDEVMDNDYFSLIEDIDGNMTLADLYELILGQYPNVKKVVFDF